jgi:dihydrolipoamide dehydrogenase
VNADAYDVVILGGGPAGYTAALGCAEAGMSTMVVERDHLGGTCLNVGCIPSKALIHAASTYHSLGAGELSRLGLGVTGRSVDLAATMRWKDEIVGQLRSQVEGLLSRGAVAVVRGEAEVIDARTVRITSTSGERCVSTRALVLATGSRPVELPHLPFGGRVMSSTDALALNAAPERLVVVGAGYIGLELGIALGKLGSTVTIVEMADRILPSFDAAMVRPVARRLTDLGIEVHTQTRAVELGADSIVLAHTDGRRSEVATDAVLVTVGRRPAIDTGGLDRLGLRINDGAIAIDDQCRTSAAGVFAIGDVTGEPMLAHRGIAQGQLVAEVLAGSTRTWDHRAVPSVCFTDPEVFAVGLRPDDPSLAGRDSVVVGQVSFGGNGRARTLGDDAGFVRIVADAESGAVLGVQGTGAHVAELGAAASLAVELGSSLADLTATITAHPTLGEALTEAAVAACRRAQAIRAPRDHV